MHLWLDGVCVIFWWLNHPPQPSHLRDFDHLWGNYALGGDWSAACLQCGRHEKCNIRTLDLFSAKGGPREVREPQAVL